ncbi:MAG: TfuA-related McrA-glycine thioamidation protein [Methanomicrobiales archaeon]|nr:TfuA-related McrA-glycine thioamidation protein [Methanomicrobiales archaeon]MDD1668512.1 TfuA-related McrA-glycine thioamidation protein [Methanomicrobiales archaeon]
MPSAVVFLGPSLDRATARSILAADYRPPAARGDLTRAVSDGPSVIGLIDGVFFQESSVGHREILAALSAGVRVVGASSMGALRAAELHTLGMEGVGEVYRMYRDGILVSDDEVALAFDPESFLALSEPLVNIRATLDRAEAEGVIDHPAGDALLSVARGLYYPDRTYPHLVMGAKGSVDPGTLARFARWVERGGVDLKRADAVQALGRIREILGEGAR